VGDGNECSAKNKSSKKQLFTIAWAAQNGRVGDIYHFSGLYDTQVNYLWGK
jgi:hypothetical protein